MSNRFRRDLANLKMVVDDYLAYIDDPDATSHASKHYSLGLDQAVRKVYTCPRCMAGMPAHHVRRLAGWMAMDTILTKAVDSSRGELPRRTTMAMRRSGAYKLGYFDALVFAHSLGAMVDFPEQPENARLIAKTMRARKGSANEKAIKRQG